MKRTEAIKEIRKNTSKLSEAISIYNFLSAYGTKEITKNQIDRFFA